MDELRLDERYTDDDVRAYRACGRGGDETLPDLVERAAATRGGAL